MFRKKAGVLSLALLFCSILSLAATVDTLNIKSRIMGRSLKAAVVLPNGYNTSSTPFPVLYLLHGGQGGFKDWLTKTPDTLLLHKLADRYRIIIVTPEGNPTSYYFDSPLDKSSLFETFISKEVVEAVDKAYPTISHRRGRAIAGLSMGGHGALFIANRHPDQYCAAGSMSGVMNINTATWKVPPEFARSRMENFLRLLGPPKDSSNPYAEYTIVGMTDRVKANGLKLILDCGVDDFLIETNRDLHRRLVSNGTPHDYIERPGKHEWPYWENALAYQMLFFHNVFKANGITSGF